MLNQEQEVMTATTFDTHKFVRTLKDAGVPKSQAEAFSEAIKEAQGEADLATKRDIDDLRCDIDVLRHDMDSRFSKRNSDWSLNQAVSWRFPLALLPRWLSCFECCKAYWP